MLKHPINRKPILSVTNSFRNFFHENAESKDEENLFSVHMLDFEIKESEVKAVLSFNNKVTNYIVNDGTKVVGYIIEGKYIKFSDKY